MILRQIIDIIESAAPLRWQQEWDNSGLQVGDTDAEISAVLVAVDVTEAVIREAIDKGCNLIISHHPLIFRGLKSLTGATPQERCVISAVRNNIAVYSSHTPIDSWLNGVSGEMAKRCGVSPCRILAPDTADSSAEHGLGVIGSLPAPVPFSAFLQTLKSTFAADRLDYTPACKQHIQTVAFCGGAGSDFIQLAAEQGADVYVTADCKYHEMQAAVGRIAVVSLDHWVSEHFVRDIFISLLKDVLPVFAAETDNSPVHSL